MVVRRAATLLLVFAVGCGTAASDAAKDTTRHSTVVIRLDRNEDSGAWPTARAEFGDQRVAFCPVSIEMGGGSDTLRCDYTIGPLRVPLDFEVSVRGDAADVAISTTPTSIELDAGWPDAHVTYRADIVRSDEAPARSDLASDVLRIGCGDKQTTAVTPLVRAWPDGLRYSVEASSDVAMFEFHHVAWEHGSSIGGRSNSGVAPIEPGAIVVACLPTERSAYWDVKFATFELVDPEGFWLERGVDRSQTSTTRRLVDPAFQDLSDGELAGELSGEVSGLGDEDGLRPAGYPEGPGLKSARWNGLVVRDGAREALVTLGFDDVLEVEACAGSNLTA